MEYLDMTDSTVLTVSYITTFKATRLHLNNHARDESIIIDLDNESVLKLINELNEIVENHEDK